MSFQTYLGTIEDRTGLTPAGLLEMASGRGYDATTKATVVIEWFKTDFGLGRGHAMAFFYLHKNGTEIGDRHIGGDGTHRDESTTLRIDGKANRAS